MSYTSSTSPTVTIRYATADDARALARLAALDSQPLPEGEMLVAQVGDELWAAYALSGDGAIADPFRPSADALSLLRARAQQLARRPDARRAFGFAPAAWLRAAVARI
jgi:hypothetical protein